MRITQYEHSHLPGVLALCTAEAFYASLPHRPYTGFRVCL